MEGRSRNPVSLLFDHLLHPNADLGAHSHSKLSWATNPSLIVDHICLGRTAIGGVWSRLKSNEFQTVSLADWMELPNYSMKTFREQRQRSVSVRATYDEVRRYYLHYVKRHRLMKYFRSECQVISMERLLPDGIWSIRGFDYLENRSFQYHCKFVVLATGVSQQLTRPLGIPNENDILSITLTNLPDVENLIIQQKRLTSESLPLLVVGSGLTAMDVILLCQRHSISVLHVFRLSIDDPEFVLNQFSSTIYPEYERLRELIRGSTISDRYQCFPSSEIISIEPNGSTRIRHLRSHRVTDHSISFVARLTGGEFDLSFLRRSSSNSLEIHPFTNQCFEMENVFAIGALAGEKLVRFLQGGAFACASQLWKQMKCK